MPVPLPRLDDRRFDDLVRDGIAHARAACPDWTDFTAGDPGVTLIEVFAFVTDALLYRLNRVPPKLQLALLNLVGVDLQAPSAATVDLLFKRVQPDTSQAIVVPAGTSVGTSDGSVEFVLPVAATIAVGEAEVRVRALHCQLIQGERLGESSGIPGQTFSIQRSPVIAPSVDKLDFMLGVETDEEGAGRTVRKVDGTGYELWSEVANFTDSPAGSKVYVLDRTSGRVQFSPSAALGGGGAIPPAGKIVRAWYRRGGGRAGNVAEATLTELKPPLQGIDVTNPERAAGGSDAETIEGLIRRAPSCLYSLRVAVTARDYEQVVREAGGIARASAVADAELWKHARPGLVAVRIMPAIEADGLVQGAVTETIVREHRVAALKERAEAALEERRPLGVLTRVDWVKVRSIAVSARVIVSPGADTEAVEDGILRRVNALLSPLNERPLGRQVRASEVYEQILAEPGVRYADGLSFTIDGTPKANVTDLVRDPHQQDCWFAIASEALHRSLDNGDSWSIEFAREGFKPLFLRRHPTVPGLTLLAAGKAKPKGSAIFISNDLGETWGEPVAQFNSELFDAAWIDRSGEPALVLATAEGMRQFIPGRGSGPSPIVVNQAIDAKGFYSVVSKVSPSGVIAVVVAARGGGAGGGGLYLSSLGGLSDTFRLIGLKDKDVRRLAVQSTGARDYLWATVAAEAEQQGQGALRIELRANGQDDPGGFVPFNLGWQGGSCEAISFAEAMVFAGSNRAGILSLDTTQATPTWTAAKIDAGLPIRDTKRLLETIDSVASAKPSARPTIVLGGSSRGVHRSVDGGLTYQCISVDAFTDRVPLPRGWLYAAGEHRIEVVRETEARG